MLFWFIITVTRYHQHQWKSCFTKLKPQTNWYHLHRGEMACCIPVIKPLTRGPWATSLTWGRFLRVFNIILHISNYLPIEGMALYLKRISSTHWCFMPSLVNINWACTSEVEIFWIFSLYFHFLLLSLL